jgi:chromosomal replication initiation ATPase DnaA
MLEYKHAANILILFNAHHAAAIKHKIPAATMLTKKRTAAVSKARFEAYYSANAQGCSLPLIAAYFRRKHHSSVMHGIRVHKENINVA